MSTPRLSYCTNVHAGTSLAACMENLDRHAVAVKAQASPNAPLGVGLWLPADAAREAAQGGGAARLCDFLDERGLFARTFNGFPHGDFHAAKVKHAVYLPTWEDESRLRYTLDLAEILAQLLPKDGTGSISTLPLGWSGAGWGGARHAPVDAVRCAARLGELAAGLARLQDRTGKHIRVALEPEPGCAFDTAPGAVRFFKDFLFGRQDERVVRAHLGICHDTCHSAVMGEAQTDALATYRAAGIGLFKIQLSSAVAADFSTRCPEARADMRAQLAAFAEDRYLHQTVVQSADGQTHFFEDLPMVLAAAARPEIDAGDWRVHFHVPLFLERFGLLDTTQDEITACLGAVQGETPDLEVETYAWGVLPPALRPARLADGIAKEMMWMRERLGEAASAALPNAPNPNQGG